ncbi:MAG: HU family DNA-binding protein [Akkermansia sp.]|nr:HU family DNA-binding protein [Akkermansia sp.]
MNRKELLELIRKSLGGTATQNAAELALNAVTRAIQDGLREDGEVKLARFGSFRLRKAAPRRLLLPGSNKELILPERRVLRFIAPPKGTNDTLQTSHQANKVKE